MTIQPRWGKKQKIAYLTVLAVAGSVWVCDRAFVLPGSGMTGPSGAVGAEPEAPRAAPAAAPATADRDANAANAAGPSALPPGWSNTGELPRQVRDLFAASREMRDLLARRARERDPNKTDPSKGPQPSLQEMRDRFRTSHTLSATVFNEAGAIAIVDGRTLELGAAFDGFSLTRIEKGRATFAKEDVEVTLVIAGHELPDVERAAPATGPSGANLRIGDGNAATRD